MLAQLRDSPELCAGSHAMHNAEYDLQALGSGEADLVGENGL